MGAAVGVAAFKSSYYDAVNSFLLALPLLFVWACFYYWSIPRKVAKLMQKDSYRCGTE